MLQQYVYYMYYTIATINVSMCYECVQDASGRNAARSGATKEKYIDDWLLCGPANPQSPQ